GPVVDRLDRTAYGNATQNSLRIPHWVAEHLTPTSIASTSSELDPNIPSRKRSVFREDHKIPHTFRSRLEDYIKTGYDRGHLVPAADVTESQKAIDETFLLTNICPQVAAGFNRGYWASLERFVRKLVKYDGFQDMYCVTGPLFLPKIASDGKYYVTYEVIGHPPNTAVPTHFFKVILGIKDGKYYSAGFVLPNQSIPSDTKLSDFEVPIDAIERSAGLTFFPQLGTKEALPLCRATPCGVLRGFPPKIDNAHTSKTK
ncbi:DNA/RNA non-specific endonuclease, partial [Cladochytrium replicatum]